MPAASTETATSVIAAKAIAEIGTKTLIVTPVYQNGVANPFRPTSQIRSEDVSEIQV
jgi:hypothetical protein